MAEVVTDATVDRASVESLSNLSEVGDAALVVGCRLVEGIVGRSFVVNIVRRSMVDFTATSPVVSVTGYDVTVWEYSVVSRPSSSSPEVTFSVAV